MCVCVCVCVCVYTHMGKDLEGYIQATMLRLGGEFWKGAIS